MLHRIGLPTAAKIADSFAHGVIYNYGFAIMARLYERVRIGKGHSRLAEPLKRAALQLSYDDHGWNIETDKNGATRGA